MRNPNQDPVEYSQARRQEHIQNADSWKHEDRVESSSSTSNRKLVREVNTKKEFHYMRISVDDDGFPTLVKKSWESQRVTQYLQLNQ